MNARKNLFLILTLLFCSVSSLFGQTDDPPPVVKQQEAFPDWMDKVTFPSDARTPGQDPQEPQDPDPSSKIRPPEGPSSKSRFQFTRPKMPDFSELRKRASKMKYERVASSSDQVASESMELLNEDAMKRELDQLASACSTAPAGPTRTELEKKLQKQKEKVSAVQELQNLLSASATQNISDDPKKARRIKELQHTLFPAMKAQNLASATIGANHGKTETVLPATKTYSIPSQFTRPEGPSSLYLEQRREKAENEESGGD